MNIATITVTEQGKYQISYYAKGNIQVLVEGDSLKNAYNSFFRRSAKYGLTDTNVAFIFSWEK